MTTTTNYGMQLPSGTDPASITPINQNTTFLDTKLKELEDVTDSVIDEIDKNTSSTSGSIVTLTDEAPLTPLKSCVCDIEAIQASGTPSPDNPLAISGWSGVNVSVVGKNLFNKDTVTNSKWLSTTTGLEENTSSSYCVSDYIPVKSGVSYFMPATGSARKWLYDIDKNPLTYLSSDLAETVTPSQDGYLRITINKNTYSLSTIQVEVGSTATDYADFNGSTTSLTWTDAGIVYGGSIDLTSGVLTKTHENIASYNGESINEPWISSMDEYTEGGTPTTGAQVVYPLTTAVTYQLTPTTIKTLSSSPTNLWCDTGDTSITYVVNDKYSNSGIPTVKAVKAYIAEMLGI